MALRVSIIDVEFVPVTIDIPTGVSTPRAGCRVLFDEVSVESDVAAP